MKKKIIISMLLSFVLLTGVVSAAGWGKFEGNNIVRILINGKEAKVKDVPAVMLNNRTMVPIYLLKDAGLDISWDGKTSTVTVNSNFKNDDANTNIYEMKNYFNAVQYYTLLSDHGDNINELKNRILIGFVGFSQLNDTSGLVEASNYQNTLVKNQKELVNLTNNITIFEYLNTSNVVANEILNNYSNALEDYQTAIENLNNYRLTSTQKYYDNFLHSQETAMKYTNNAISSADKEINVYSKKISGY